MDADIVQISSLVGGKLIQVNFDEGDTVSANMVLAQIDQDALVLKKSQQMVQLQELRLNADKLQDQILQLNTEWNYSKELLDKTEKMLLKGAATTQQRDELKTKTVIQESQYKALSTQAKIILNQMKQLEIAISLTQKQISDSSIKTPIFGIVLNRYHVAGENVSPGGLIAEIADLSKLTAIIYVPFNQLTNIKLGQEVTVSVTGLTQKFPGKITWISSESEFTPKTIMTAETQETLVYQVKITVPNPNQMLKIGMPVDVEIH